MAADALPFSAPSERNKGPILAVLRDVLPATARVLEIASGTGQHAEHFTAEMPGWTWQPTDGDALALPGIAARCVGRGRVLPPLHLDVLSPTWPVAPAAFDALYCANMLHISPWATCAALMRGAARHLRPGGVLALYGPYLVDGEPTAPGNVAFDRDLRARNALWGLRRLADVVDGAQREGLGFVKRVAMPANNLVLIFRLG
jgi:SAM-dependent methyltransferase